MQGLLPIGPANRGRGRRPEANRSIINGILWRLRRSTPWRDAPPQYDNWNTICRRFRQWSAAGVRETVFGHAGLHFCGRLVFRQRFKDAVKAFDGPAIEIVKRPQAAPASSSSPGAGWWKNHSPGSDAAADWRRTGRLPSHPQMPGHWLHPCEGQRDTQHEKWPRNFKPDSKRFRLPPRSGRR